MMDILSLIFNAENVRLILLAVLGYCGYVQINRRMDRMEYSLNKRIDELRMDTAAQINELKITTTAQISELNSRINELKYNDFAHLSSAFEVLTYVLEKNGSIKEDDKKFVDSRLTVTV